MTVGGKEFLDVIKGRTLRRGRWSWIKRQALNVILSVLIKQSAGAVGPGRRPTWWWKQKSEWYPLNWRWRGHQASDLGGLKSWKRQGRDSPLNLGLGQWGWSGLLCHTVRF